MKPKVSIVIVTYNHENFIAQAIESAIAQKVDFGIEIIVGEDASIDSTAKIVKSYSSKYPDIIKPIYRAKNIGLVKNYADCILRACGKYIAVLAGDDFWTDVYKLQKQIDFLDENPEYALYGVGAIVMEHNGKKLRYNGVGNSIELTTGDLFLSNPFFASQVVYRNIFQELPEIFFDADTEDRQIYKLLSVHGKLFFDPLIIGGVYRVHSNSLTRNFLIDPKLHKINRLYERIRKNVLWNKYFDGKYNKQAVMSSKRAYAKIFQLYVSLGKFKKAYNLLDCTEQGLISSRKHRLVFRLFMFFHRLFK